MIMRLIWCIAFLSATFIFHNVYADTRCEVVDVSQRVLGFCRTLLFKRYVATTAVGFHSEVGQVIDLLVPRAESWSRKSEQGDKWSFCLTAGTLCPANQERP